MLNCYVFFLDPLMVGKVAAILENLGESIFVHKVVDARQLLDLPEQKRDLIITDYSCFQELEDDNVDIDLFGKVLLVDEVESEVDGNLVYINRSQILIAIATHVLDYISENHVEVEYVSIKVDKLVLDQQNPCDFFVKKADDTYALILKKGLLVNGAIIEKIKANKIEKLYVSKNEYPLLMEFINSHREVEAIFCHKVEVNAVEAMHDFVSELGFDPKVISMTKSLHEGVEKRYTDKYMKKLLGRFKNMEGSYLYNHSFLTSVIGLGAADHFSWMNYENREKIYLGSIMHDLGLKNKDNAIKDAMTLGSIRKLSADEQEDILGHSTRFATFLKEAKDVHPDVVKMVEFHHAVDEKNAYPRKISAMETNLVFCLFILSHEFSVGLYKINFDENKIPTLLNQLAERFNHGNYKKLLPSFRKSIEDTLISKAA